MGALLVLVVGSRRCAFPVERVEETLRPLPLHALRGAPEFVRGVSIVRGAPIPVVDLGLLFGDAPTADAMRLVSLKVGADRRVGVLATGVLGLRREEEMTSAALPPLFAEASPAIDRLGRLDAALLAVLQAGRLVPQEVWEGLDIGENEA